MSRVQTKILNYQSKVVEPFLTELVKSYFDDISNLLDTEGPIAMMCLKNRNDEWLKFCQKKHPCRVEFNKDLFTQIVDKVILEAKNTENEQQ